MLFRFSTWAIVSLFLVITGFFTPIFKCHAEESISLRNYLTEESLDEKLGQLERYHRVSAKGSSVSTRLRSLERKSDNLSSDSSSLRYRLEELYRHHQILPTEPARLQALKLYNNAIDATEQGLVPEAKTLYSQALQLNPSFVEAANNLGALFEQQGDYNSAATLYWQSLVQNPENPLLYRNLGITYEKQGRLPEAVEAFEAYIALAEEPEPGIVEMVKQLSVARLELDKAPADYVDATTESSQGLRLTWPGTMMPVPVYVVWHSPDQGRFLPVIQEAMREWEEATEGRVSFKLVQHPAMSRIILTLSDGPLSHPHQNVGHTAFQVDPNVEQPQDTLRVKIRVNTGRPGEVTEDQRLVAVRRFALHEFGHALGIWGHSDNPADVMFTHPLVTDLSPRDKTTIVKLYTREPGGRLERSQPHQDKALEPGWVLQPTLSWR